MTCELIAYYRKFLANRVGAAPNKQQSTLAFKGPRGVPKQNEKMPKSEAPVRDANGTRLEGEVAALKEEKVSEDGENDETLHGDNLGDHLEGNSKQEALAGCESSPLKQEQSTQGG